MLWFRVAQRAGHLWYKYIFSMYSTGVLKLTKSIYVFRVCRIVFGLKLLNPRLIGRLPHVIWLIAAYVMPGDKPLPSLIEYKG